MHRFSLVTQENASILNLEPMHRHPVKHVMNNDNAL